MSFRDEGIYPPHSKIHKSQTYQQLNRIACEVAAAGLPGSSSHILAAAAELERLRQYEKFWRAGISPEALKTFKIEEK